MTGIEQIINNLTKLNFILIYYYRYIKRKKKHLIFKILTS